MLRFSGRTLLLTVSVSSSSSYVPLLLMLLTLSYNIDFQIYICSSDIVSELWSPLSTAKPAFPPGCPVCSLMDTSCFLSTCWLVPPSPPDSPKLEAWILSLILFSDPPVSNQSPNNFDSSPWRSLHPLFPIRFYCHCLSSGPQPLSWIIAFSPWSGPVSRSPSTLLLELSLKMQIQSCHSPA